MASTVEKRIDTLSKEIDTLAKECQNKEDARKKLLGAIIQGMAKVESPVETIWRILMSVSLLSSCRSYRSSYLVSRT